MCGGDIPENKPQGQADLATNPWAGKVSSGLHETLLAPETIHPGHTTLRLLVPKSPASGLTQPGPGSLLTGVTLSSGVK